MHVTFVWNGVRCHYIMFQYDEISNKCWTVMINTLRLRPNWHHLSDAIFKCIFLNENVWIPIKISLKFVPQGPVNNIPVVVQIMAWRRSGNKPLSEPMLVSLPMHLCLTRPQWVNRNIVGTRNDIPYLTLSPCIISIFAKLDCGITAWFYTSHREKHCDKAKFYVTLLCKAIPVWSWGLCLPMIDLIQSAGH